MYTYVYVCIRLYMHVYACIYLHEVGGVGRRVLTLAEQGGLRTELEGQKRLVQGVTDRLCAWESELATEAKATKAKMVVHAMLWFSTLGG